MTLPRAVIIIPTYNERENVRALVPVLLDVFKAVPNWDMHVLFVDDSSPDETGKEVEKFHGRHSNVHLFSNKEKQGLGHAYLVGMEYAIEKLHADVVFEMDADFSHDPSRVPAFLSEIEKGADMVLGSRYIKGGSIPTDWGTERKFLSVMGNIIIMTILTDFRIRDWTTGYRAIKAEVVKAVRPELSNQRFSGYTFQIGFLHKAVRKNFTIVEVPLRFVDRTIGNSKLGPEYIKNTLTYILTARFKEITQSHIFKFGVVGGIGFVINAVGLELFHSVFKLSAGNAAALGAEIAIISNFILNNSWTFSEQQAKTPKDILTKFVKFNIGSLGAVLIQKVVVGLGTSYTSDAYRFVWFFFAVIIGMVVNYTIYSKIIWKKK